MPELESTDHAMLPSVLLQRMRTAILEGVRFPPGYRIPVLLDALRDDMSPLSAVVEECAAVAHQVWYESDRGAVLLLSGVRLALDPGSLIVFRGPRPDPVVLEQLEALLVNSKCKGVFLAEDHRLEEIPRDQALGLLVSIVGMGETQWGELPTEALEKMAKVHRNEAAAMQGVITKRARGE